MTIIKEAIMGVLDFLSNDSKVTISYSDFYGLLKSAAKAEFALNGIRNGVDNNTLYLILEGKPANVNDNNITLEEEYDNALEEVTDEQITD